MNTGQGLGKLACVAAVVLLFSGSALLSGACAACDAGHGYALRSEPGKSPCASRMTYMVPMRDGTKLATDVYLPDTIPAPHGAILIRTPYNKSTSLAIALGTLWANLGWPMVIQDMRGRFASEGLDTVFRNDSLDSYDSVEWVANHTWCNGNVGTWGYSALGITQYLGAKAAPPHLKSEFIGVATPDLYEHVMFQGGVFRKSMVGDWLAGQGSTYMLPTLLNNSVKSSFWDPVTVTGHFGNVNTPAVHVGGWYDCMDQGIIDGFMGYEYEGSKGAANSSLLVMGPWTHGGTGRNQGELQYPANAQDTITGNLFSRQAAYCLQGTQNGFENESKVRYYVMGDVNDSLAPGNYWRTAAEWPIPSVDTPFYLDGSAMSLDATPPAAGGGNSYDFDPAHPVPTVGGAELTQPPGPRDQRKIEGRPDVLVYTTPPLAQPFECTGRVKAKLYVSSNCTDTDFTVKLSDVYPDGRSMLVLDGILRMRFRDGVDHETLMTPGTTYGITVDLWSTSIIFNAGHSIRVVVSSSNYPRFDANPNTGEKDYHNTTYKVANNTVLWGGSSPSCIILPTPSALQAPVLSLGQVAPGNSKYWLNWTLTLGSTGYVLQEDKNPSFTNPVSLWFNGPKSVSDFVSGKPSATYYYRVKAVNHTAETAWSNVVSASVVSVPEAGAGLLAAGAFAVAVVAAVWERRRKRGWQMAGRFKH